MLMKTTRLMTAEELAQMPPEEERTRTITVYRSLTDIRVLTADDTLDGGNVLPGFTVSVKNIFE